MNITKINQVIIFIIALPFFSIAQETVSDYEGNKYGTVRIGEQVWMTSNLSSSLDANGDTIESYCFYNDESYCEKYGRLYPWTALYIDINEEFPQGICPPGWHVPTDREWDELASYLGGDLNAGSLLKNSDSTGFNIQFSGNYNTEVKVFSYIDDHAYFWTSTKFSNTASWMRQIGRNNININRSTVPVIYAFSIRCLKD
jgi:uncharacterized protein (TIGR02145 family)